MEEFRTECAMEHIHREIAAGSSCLSELSFMTFYYRKLVQMLKVPNQLVLFGAGKYGEIILDALKQEGIYSVQCFCDNSEKAIGRFVRGVEILSPQEALKRYPEACFIITPKDYENEILRQLVHMGVEIDNIVIFNIKNTGMAVE